MAIQVQTVGATDLRLAANVNKTADWTVPRVGGALDGLTVGHWQAVFVRLPTGFTANADYVVMGADNGGGTPTGNFPANVDTSTRIGGDHPSRGASRLRPVVRLRSPGGDAFAGTSGAEGIGSTLPQMVLNTPYLMLHGISYLEHLATPGWYGWISFVPLTGAEAGQVSSYIAATPISTAWLQSTTSLLFRQLFAAFGTGSARTPVGFTAEHLALAQGDFPWDTANNRPHHDVVRALAGFGTNPFLTYPELAAAQAAGMTGYSNCSPGRSDITHYWTLRNLAAGLTNSGSAGTATLVQTDHNSLTGGLIDAADMAPAHWAPLTLNPLGLSSTSLVQGSATTINITGTRAGSTLAVQSGSLPAGLTLDSAARTISGTPTTVGSSSFTLRETLAGADNSPRDTALALDVVATPTLAALTLSPTTVTTGSAATISIGATTGGSTITVATGSLPAGLTLDSAARTITGTPTTAGTSNFTLRETLAGASNTPRDTALSITVNAAVAAPTITQRLVRFHGGRGARALAVSGTRDAAATVERRWERMSDNSALTDFDWAPVATQSGTSWTTSDVLPVGGPYRLRVRNVSNPAQAVSSDDWLVGTAALLHGQSGMERALFQGNAPGANNLAVAVASGAQGIFLKLNNQSGGTSSAYLQPDPEQVRLRSGETPVVGTGAVTMLNEWHTNSPNHPLLMIPMAINGTEMPHWVNDDGAYIASPGNGHPSFRFLGTIGAVAGPDGTSGNNSGVVETYAALVDRFVDLHMLMWNPSIGTTPTVRGNYVAAIDARFSNSPSAPWVLLPPWRVHRDPSDQAGAVAVRENHVLMQQELGARGILGPCWLDIVSDRTGSGHSAFNSAPGVPSPTLPVSDANQVGQSRLGRSLGRVAAWVWDRTIKANSMRLLAAWWMDPVARNQIMIDTGRQIRTLGGAGLLNLFWISEAGGAWTNAGFTAALVTEGNRTYVRLTRDGGAAWNATTRVDYGRDYPARPGVTADESNSERVLDGLIYDDQRHRGGTNFTGAEAGNPLQGANIVSTSTGGIPVAVRGAARLVAMQPMTTTRAITARLMAPDGVTVLREKSDTAPAG